MSLELRRYSDIAHFRAVIDDYVRANINQCSQIFANTKSLTNEQLHERQAWLTALHQDGEIRGVAIITTPLPLRTLSLSPISEESAALIAEAIRADGIRLDGVLGSAQSPARLTQAMEVQTRERVRLGNHVLDSAPLRFPAKGAMRAATMADYALLLEWELAFILEAGLPDNRAALSQEVREHLSGPAQLMWIWEVDTVPVAMVWARACQPIARVGMVYTVPEHRGNGYAAAFVGEISAKLREEGCLSIFLFTDLANPTSNGIYRRIGYRLLDEFAHLDVV